jgi:hypothetical protein
MTIDHRLSAVEAGLMAGGEEFVEEDAAHEASRSGR